MNGVRLVQGPPSVRLDPEDQLRPADDGAERQDQREGVSTQRCAHQEPGHAEVFGYASPSTHVPGISTEPGEAEHDQADAPEMTAPCTRVSRCVASMDFVAANVEGLPPATLLRPSQLRTYFEIRISRDGGPGSSPSSMASRVDPDRRRVAQTSHRTDRVRSAERKIVDQFLDGAYSSDSPCSSGPVCARRVRAGSEARSRCSPRSLGPPDLRNQRSELVATDRTRMDPSILTSKPAPTCSHPGQTGRRKGASTFSFAPHPPTASSALAIDRVEGSPAAS